jgi:site-specific recombinase XerD
MRLRSSSKSKLRSGSKLLSVYLNFLRHHQCVAEATINIRRIFISPFLESIGKLASPSRLGGLGAQTIHEYVISRSPALHRASKKHLTSTLRNFLRFAYIKGYLKHNLIDAVPIIATRKLDRVPRSIPWKSVQALLKAPDRRTHIGRRDYAVILLLATYGVRIGQVTHLKLKDVHWKDGTINFQASKGGKPLQLPLYPEVAKALLDYIKRDRGHAPFAEVFLTCVPTQRPFSENNHFGTTLDRYYKKADLSLTIRGSHAIRHAFATRLVEQGTPIKTIADLLGHRWIGTTFIYTKVDLPRLRTLAREWPEVFS